MNNRRALGWRGCLLREEPLSTLRIRCTAATVLGGGAGACRVQNADRGRKWHHLACKVAYTPSRIGKEADRKNEREREGERERE